MSPTASRAASAADSRTSNRTNSRTSSRTSNRSNSRAHTASGRGRGHGSSHPADGHGDLPAPHEVTGKDVVDLLQPLLVDLIALAHNGKQAHWHVRGSTFTQVHLQLDDVIADARTYADEVAERVVALGTEVDGRPATVAETAGLPTFPAGFLEVPAVLAAMCDQLAGTIDTARRGLDRLDEIDPPTQDIVNGILRGLEKHLWMLKSQLF